ncbi:MAG: M1 family aminopeptidase [Ginsengibacter sp.]
MNKILIGLIFFYSAAYSQKNSVNNGKIHAIAEYEQRMSLNSFNSGYKATLSSENFNVIYYRCEWKTDPQIRFIDGCVTSYFILDPNVDHIIYDLSDSLIVDSVKQKNYFLSFSRSNNTVQINFNQSSGVTKLDSVSIYYHGIPASTGFGSFINSIHNNIPVMWTLSEPFGSRDWWPCKNGLDDKADSIDVYITAPVQYTSVSNGLRQSEVITGDQKITHWKHRYPIASYLICMAITNYAEFENQVQSGNTNLMMQTFCYPESLALFQQNTPLVLASLQYFSKVFGPYPFIKEKYGQVQFSWGGGMEHQTSTFIVSPDESLMAHELAHQWFGDKITTGSWQNIWLNEGFATHLASMDMENKYPLTVRDTRKREIENITSVSNGSVFVKDTTKLNNIFNSRLVYTKGSHLLYMLRWILSDSVFFNGMRSYFNDPAIAFDFATTKDFQRNMEEVSGKNLDYFFKEWFYGEGYPSYDIQWSQLNHDFVQIKLNQKTSDPSVNFFTLPVALQFKNSTKQKTIVVDNKFNGEIFTKEIDFIADTVIVDPDYWLITKYNTSEKLINPVKNSIKFYPSPFSKLFRIEFNNFSPTKAELKIYDSKGRLMFKDYFTLDNFFTYLVNADRFAKGIYFIKIQTDNGLKFAEKILSQ